MVLLPADLASDKIGGIQSFVRDFIKFAPPDLAIEVVGATTDERERPIGRWHRVEVEGRSVGHFAVAGIRAQHDRARVPVALRYTLGLLRWRRQIQRRGRVLQFHRAGTPLAFIDRIAPAVQVVHLNVADIYRESGESRWRMLPGLYHRVEGLTIGRMSRIFVVNEEGVRFYRERHPRLADRIQFMPTWFDDSIFGRLPADERRLVRQKLLASLELAGSADRLVLFVGRLERQKDPELLVESFAAALERGIAARLLIVGDGGLRQVTDRRARAIGLGDRIHFLGFRPRHEIARLLGAADCFLLASRFEGMPISVLEALASGLPVVSTSVGEVPRLVGSGVNGWLAADRTPGAIAEGLVNVLGDDADQMAEAAVRSAAPYASSAVLGPFYEAHRQVLAGAT
jgi:glycosyltransferase involved in cell wall biosynthesis